MKIRLLLLLALSCSFNGFSQGWDLITPLKISKSVTDIEAVNETTFYLLQKGNSNDILKTTDSGATWSRIRKLTDSTWDIHMFNENEGLISTNLGVYKTTDGFVSLTSQQDLSFNIYKFFFVDTLIGYGVGNDGNVVKTTDGGASWSELVSGLGNNNDLLSVFFVNENVGYICGEYSKILKTTDGGQTWDVQTVGSARWNDMYFYDELNGVVIGNHEDLKYTNDGGQTWIDSNFQIDKELYEIKNINNELVVCGDDGVILKSTDQGVNWSETVLDNFKDHYSMAHYNTSIMISGEAVAYHSNNSGGNWNLVQDGVRETYLRNIDFANNQNGVVIGYPNYGSTSVILTTTDGGEEWELTKVITSSSVNFTNIDLTEDGYGIATRTSTSGTFYYTSDYGLTWQNRNSGNNNGDFACYMRSQDQYTLGGDQILNTNNNGFDWQVSDVSNIDQIYFYSDLIGYAIGSSIYKTIDGGVSWNEISEPGTTWTYNQIQFVTENIGFVDSTTTGLYKTTDGGMTWNQVNGAASSLKFLALDENTIINMAGNGVRYTADGGQNWTIINNYSGASISNAIILNGTIIGIGANSDIYKVSIPTFDILSAPNVEETSTYMIYPNPTHDVIHVKHLNAIANIAIQDINGRLLRRIENVDSERPIDVSDLPNGIYFLEIQSGNSKETKKFIKH